MPHGAKTREKILLFRAEDLRDGLSFALHHRKVALGNPEQALKETLAVQNLAGLHFQDPAGGILDGLFAAEGSGIKPQALLGKQERLNLSQVAEIFVGQDQADQSRRCFGDHRFGSFAGGGEHDFARLAELAGLAALGADLLYQHLLPVKVLGADGLAGGLAIGRSASKAGRGFGAVADGGY